jgi:hypothetical protein
MHIIIKFTIYYSFSHLPPLKTISAGYPAEINIILPAYINKVLWPHSLLLHPLLSLHSPTRSPLPSLHFTLMSFFFLRSRFHLRENVWYVSVWLISLYLMAFHSLWLNNTSLCIHSFLLGRCSYHLSHSTSPHSTSYLSLVDGLLG